MMILRDRLRSDPVFFCREVLGVDPWSRQREVLAALCGHDRVSVRSGHGTGKSFIASCAALWFLYAFYPAKVITTAPTQTQVRHVLWNEIRRLHARARVPLGGSVLEERIQLGDDAFAMGIATDAAERLQGYHAEHLLVILDEAPGVRPEIWEAAETLLTGRVGKILAIGNPTVPAGLFYDTFREGSDWERLKISCLDSPNLRDEGMYPRLVGRRWIEARRREWGEGTPLWQARVLGEFPDDATNVLVPRPWLESLPVIAARCGELRLGVDVARHGEDATVFCLRDDAGVIHDEEQHGWTTMQTTGSVMQLVETHGILPENVFIDDTGVGAGVTDRLREQGQQVTAVVAAARADDPAHFTNRRAEMFWRLREALSPDAPARLAVPRAFAALRRELTALTYGLASSGAIYLDKKTELRASLHGSPNHADALALTYVPAAPRRADPGVMIF